MVLLPTEKLLSEFERRVASASQIDIAVAWVGPSPALELLRDATRRRKIKVRAAVGLSGNGTNPEALRSLQEFAKLRIANGSAGIFHAKFYLFHSAAMTTCWVGSANFTLGGFVSNSELVTEFSDDGAARRWFDEFWGGLNPESASEIKHYVDNWKRPPGGSPQKTDSRKLAIGSDPVRLLQATPNTWDKFVVALRACDAYWKERYREGFSVLNPEWSFG
jgi:HKD family nuclease